jgi:hypothetical protein
MSKECTCPSTGEHKEKRFCKGCYADVTETMFCHCGEFPLIEQDTLSESEISEPNPEIRE